MVFEPSYISGKIVGVIKVTNHINILFVSNGQAANILADVVMLCKIFSQCSALFVH